MTLNPAALMGLFQRYGNLKSADITTDVVKDVAKALKFPFTDEGLELTARTIAEGDLESLADYVGQPERLKGLMASLAGGTPEPTLCRCPHCSGLFELHFEKPESEFAL